MGTPSPNGQQMCRTTHVVRSRRRGQVSFSTHPTHPTRSSHARGRGSVLGIVSAAFLLTGCGDTSGPPAVDHVGVVETVREAEVGAVTPVTVEARDGAGVAIAGAVLRFSTESGAGSVSPREAVTGPTGQASVSWTLGTTAGHQVLKVETNGTSTEILARSLAGAPAEVAIVAGDEQHGAVGDPLALPLEFESRDVHGNASGGAGLALSVDAGDGTLDLLEGVTGPDGRLTVHWTLGPVLGPQRIVATMDGTATVTASAEGEPGPAALLEAVSGGTQTGTVGSTLPEPLVVRATDRFGNPSRSIVRFRTGPDGGTVTVTEAQPGPDGLVTTGWVLGTRSGQATVLATAADAPEVAFDATVLPGAPAALLKTAGDSQEGPATRALAQPLEVRVEDAFGNGVPDSPVAFSVLEGGGSVQPGSPSTDPEGYARATFVLGPVIGAHSVAVSFAGAAGTGGGSGPVTFQASATSLPPARVTVVAGSGQSTLAGSTVASAPSVLVSDAVGNPVPGVTVSFSASGGGSVSDASPVTGATGVATVGSWTLGTTAGQQSLTATVVGLPAVTVQAVALPGPASSIHVAAGNGQSAMVGAPVSVRPAVDVRDAHGNAVAGVSVTFAVAGGGGSVSGSPAMSNGSGRATIGSWTLGPSAGANSITASAPGLAPVSFSATGSSPPPGFTMEAQFVGSPSASQQAIVRSAVARWNRLVTADLPDASVNLSAGACGVGHAAYSGTVDDLVVFVEFVTIDGPGGTLGSAGPCWVRGGSMLPIFGSIRMDAADVANLESNGRLYDVVLHELGHVLGIGTLWQGNGLIQGAGSSDPNFSGSGAISEYVAGGGAHANPVPVENTGGTGTRDAHWRESLFTTELMTGWVNFGAPNPLSRVTAASLADIGYSVNLSAADSFAAAAPSAYPVAPPLQITETPLGITLVIR